MKALLVRPRRLALLVPLALTGALVAGSAATGAAPLPRTYALPGAVVFPEGITASGTTFYVTSTTDGTIFRGTLGDPSATVLVPGSSGRSAVGLDVTADGSRLVVAGGGTGTVSVYDTATGSLVRQFDNRPTPGYPTFLNDVAIAPNGDAYITDSLRPALYVLRAADITGGGSSTGLRAARTFAGTPLVYGPGFNLNGIVINADGASATVVQSSTGKLYRLGPRRRGEPGRPGWSAAHRRGTAWSGTATPCTWCATRSAGSPRSQLSADGRTGELLTETLAPTFRYPTTSAVVDGQLLVVNSQFDKRGPGLTPETPFTVSSIQAP